MSKSRKSTPGLVPRPNEPEPLESVSGVRALMNTFEQTIGGGEVKVSVTEYIRLVQLEREVKAEEPTDIEVIWTERLESLYEGAD